MAYSSRPLMYMTPAPLNPKLFPTTGLTLVSLTLAVRWIVCNTLESGRERLTELSPYRCRGNPGLGGKAIPEERAHKGDHWRMASYFCNSTYGAPDQADYIGTTARQRVNPQKRSRYNALDEE